MELITERLILRDLNQEDFEAVHAYTSDPENVRYMTWGPYDEAGTRAFLDKIIARQGDTPRTSYVFAITLKESGRLIGHCGIYLTDEGHQAVLGWILHRDYWNRGYMTESVKALLKFGFEGLRLHRICAYCNTENGATSHVMEKCGMRREGAFLKSKRGRPGMDKEWNDEYLYAILAEEWRGDSSSNKAVK